LPVLVFAPVFASIVASSLSDSLNSAVHTAQEPMEGATLPIRPYWRSATKCASQENRPSIGFAPAGLYKWSA
jgi:hypothetical protein